MDLFDLLLGEKEQKPSSSQPNISSKQNSNTKSEPLELLNRAVSKDSTMGNSSSKEPWQQQQQQQQASTATAAAAPDPWRRMMQKRLEEFSTLPLEVQQPRVVILTTFHPVSSATATSASPSTTTTPLQQVECWMDRHMVICVDSDDDQQKQMDSWNFLGALFHTIHMARATHAQQQQQQQIQLMLMHANNPSVQPATRGLAPQQEIANRVQQKPLLLPTTTSSENGNSNQQNISLLSLQQPALKPAPLPIAPVAATTGTTKKKRAPLSPSNLDRHNKRHKGTANATEGGGRVSWKKTASGEEPMLEGDYSDEEKDLVEQALTEYCKSKGVTVEEFIKGYSNELYEGAWPKIALNVQGRSIISVYQHGMHANNPFTQGKWSKEEIERLLQLKNKGKSWIDIQNTLNCSKDDCVAKYRDMTTKMQGAANPLKNKPFSNEESAQLAGLICEELTKQKRVERDADIAELICVTGKGSGVKIPWKKLALHMKNRDSIA